MSAGKITSGKQAEYSNYIGSVVGYVESGKTTTITHCYWTSDVGNYNAYGSGNPTIGSETKQITLNTTTVDNLNSYNSSWNKWLLNTNNKPITFKINNGKGFSFSSQLILLPDPANTKTEFRGWFTDNALTEKFTASEVATDTTLYGSLSYIVTFDGNGGTPSRSSKEVHMTVFMEIFQQPQK